MSDPRCSIHPGAEAAWRCDGCQELLCRDSIQDGHRLLFRRLRDVAERHAIYN